MQILVIAPHPDDETIGCGGSLCLHVVRGDSVSVVFLTSGEFGLKQLPRKKAWAIREAEAAKAARILKVQNIFFLRCSDWTLNEEIALAATRLQPLIKRIAPEIIYIPHPNDGHPDHQATLSILRAALGNKTALEITLRLYEVWTPLSRYDLVQNITPVMERKLRALRAHKSQLTDFDYVQAVTGLAQYRGAMAGKCKYAEVFAQVNSGFVGSIQRAAES